MSLLCIGLNHETAPVAVRERLALSGEAREKTLQWLNGHPGILEALILSTCNRVEFYLVTEDEGFRMQALLEGLFSDHLGLDSDALRDSLYTYSFHKAIGHLFAVTSGMDSMVIGEPQIAGQVKEAYRNAVHQKSVGTILNRLLHKSFSVSKRVRTETELAARAVSVSYVAVELAKKIFGDLADRSALLAGAGEMAELAATHLANQGIERIYVASRTLENAERLARSFRGEALPLPAIQAFLTRIDILICSTAAPDYILRAEQVREAMRARRHRPLFIIDMAVPRNIDPRADDLENVYLYDMDDLQRVLESNMEQRRKELTKAEAIVQDEIHSFVQWLDSLNLVPTIVSLRDRMEEIRRQEVEKALTLLGRDVDEQQRKTIEAMSLAIVNKIAHGPISQMKQAEKRGESSRLVESVRRLFSLDPKKGS